MDKSCYVFHALAFGHGSEQSGYTKRDAYFSAAAYRASGHDCVAAVIVQHDATANWAREVLPLHGPAHQPAGRMWWHS